MPDPTGTLPATLFNALIEAERRLGGTLGVVAHRLDGGHAVAYHDDQAFPAASTIKVFILQSLLEHVEAGARRLDDRHVLKVSDQVTGSGILKALSPGQAYTLLDLATLMIIVSDNTATNMLIEDLGVEAVNASAARLGWTSTQLAGLLQRTSRGERTSTSESTTSPRDLADAFTRLWRGELLRPDLTELAMGIYRGQQHTEQLGRFLPFDPYSTEIGEARLAIASKGGAIRGIRNDAGIIDSGHTSYVLSIMTRDCPDPRFNPDNLGSLVVSEVSRTLYEYLAA